MEDRIRRLADELAKARVPTHLEACGRECLRIGSAIILDAKMRQASMQLREGVLTVEQVRAGLDK